MSDYSYGYAQQTLEYIQKFTHFKPKTAIVAGSGLGGIADMVKDSVQIYARDIPNWPGSTAPGHAGKIIIGQIHGRPVILLQGRIHCYEGYSMKAVTFPTRIAGMMGVKEYIATNASGAVNRLYNPGDIIAMKDHINLMGSNPLSGPNEDRWNERFPDMTHTYDSKILDFLSSEIGLKKGVYAAMSGPSFETPAEINMLKILGADLVGMSTVPEVITANAMGMRVTGLSCVANMAAGIEPDKTLTAQEVLEVMEKFSDKLAEIIISIIDKLNQE